MGEDTGSQRSSSPRVAALPAIPAKRYFTIGEVSALCNVKPYVLRYWEQEFAQLKPMKRRGNRRYYQHHEVLLIRRIRELLYDEGFTISGARNRLAELGLGMAARIDSAADEPVRRDLVDDVAFGADGAGAFDRGFGSDGAAAAFGVPAQRARVVALEDGPREPVSAQPVRASTLAAARVADVRDPIPVSDFAARVELRAELLAIRQLLD